MDSQKIGQFIAALRKERNLTQQGLADRLGVTNKAVSKWERGDGLPDISLMTGLADALGVTVDDLLRGRRSTAEALEEPAPSEDGTMPAVPLSAAAQTDHPEAEQETPESSLGEAGDTLVFDAVPLKGITGARHEATQKVLFDGPEDGEGLEADGSDEAVSPFYCRRWFYPLLFGIAAAVFALVLILIFLVAGQGKRQQGTPVSSDTLSPVITNTTVDAGKTTASSTTAATVTTTTSTTTTTTITPSVPTIPEPAANPPLPGTGAIPEAKHAILFNATQGRIVYGYGYDERCYPASLTKLLTAIVALENAEENTVFTVGDELLLVQEGSSIAYLEQGQQMKRDVLLHALLLDSGGDAAYVLAAGIGRTAAGDASLSAQEAVEVFCTLMNQKAKELGAVSSHFTNPDGFHDSSHYTTPMDILTISRYAYSLPEIRATVSESYIYDRFETGEEKTWWNTNLLVRYDSEYCYAGATGLKTGYTDEAGDCVVATAEKNGVTLFAVVMGAPNDTARWEDAWALLDAGFAS